MSPSYPRRYRKDECALRERMWRVFNLSSCRLVFSTKSWDRALREAVRRAKGSNCGARFAVRFCSFRRFL